ncbi:tRNA uridine-5-carboxymethylaminomethyl(34) synthesis GTPase MnmE [Gammaproteobacteria bacterium]|nr:tRNA uridine-5-carboxymethylaminomethyl(34) synthesis GTPase MnmE [Gammaproteobacteria bacterium]MDC1190809.1 tRNA uridine-5-carboxymethylaminomethyl(34) synthesis GTPase MnmE [Gammaproteobacteria bacterium]
MNTVYALATPASKSALCIFRVSGDGCLDSFNVIFDKHLKEPRTFYHRSLMFEEKVIDRVGVVFFQGSSGFTGEDSFEIYAHGGLAVMGSIVDLFKELGFDEAGPGEFTKRAFLNNKISLSEAESVIDVINASDKDFLEISVNSLSGGFSEEVFGFSARVDQLRKFVEGSIDFSDEDYDFIAEGGVVDDVSRLCADFGGFINKCFLAGEGDLRQSVLFVGPPNSGKSSLFNRLLGAERALVSEVPGTTRDLIESEVFYNNSSFGVMDSAGIRDTADEVEKQGIGLTMVEIEKADVVVGVFDFLSRGRLLEISNLVGDKNFISVLNKSDTGLDNDFQGFDLFVSAKTGDGMVELKKKISSYSQTEKLSEHKYFARTRHIKLFNSGLGFLEAAMFKLRAGEDVELAAEDLRLARVSLDEVVGVKTSDSLLGDIFKDFCIGK